MVFKIEATSSCSQARATTLTTSHSCIQTPVFMPVGTQCCVKSLDFIDLKTHLNAKIILANTYHLYLRPTADLIEKMGGLHRFSGFDSSFLTDSGGFQAFSLSKNMKKDDCGIHFKSHIDGSSHYFTPTKVLEIQYALNSDIIMVLDDLIGLPAPKERIQKSINLTTKWAKESLEHHQKQQEKGTRLHHQLFAIIQGGSDKVFRQQSANDLCSLEYCGKSFDGFAIGGLAVGESTEEMYNSIEYVNAITPKNKPRYLMGVGTPENMIEAIERGVDMFDCVMPSRNARNGSLFTHFGKLHIKSSRYRQQEEPIDPQCVCYTCKNFSRSYLHHLYRANEMTYFRLATIHNLHYYLGLMKSAREAILQDNWYSFKQRFYNQRQTGLNE